MYLQMYRSLFAFFSMNRALGIDEEMVAYTGRFPTKQFMHGKPIKWGYKLFILSDTLAYPYHILPYQGRMTVKEKKPLGEYVVLKMVEIVNQVCLL